MNYDTWKSTEPDTIPEPCAACESAAATGRDGFCDTCRPIVEREMAERDLEQAAKNLRSRWDELIKHSDKYREALEKIRNMTDGHPINADRRDRINEICRKALEIK